MLDLHALVAILVLAVTFVAGLLGGLTLWRRREPGHLGRNLLALGQTVLIAQVALGLLLLSDERNATDRLHYAYGFLSLAAVLSPWFYAPAEPRRRLAWFTVATLLAGALAVRAYTTS